MNIDTIIKGLIAILLGLIGVMIESNKSAKENKERGWNWTRGQLVIGTWALLISGTLLILIGIFKTD